MNLSKSSSINCLLFSAFRSKDQNASFPCTALQLQLFIVYYMVPKYALFHSEQESKNCFAISIFIPKLLLAPYKFCTPKISKISQSVITYPPYGFIVYYMVSNVQSFILNNNQKPFTIFLFIPKLFLAPHKFCTSKISKITIPCDTLIHSYIYRYLIKNSCLSFMLQV